MRTIPLFLVPAVLAAVLTALPVASYADETITLFQREPEERVITLYAYEPAMLAGNAPASATPDNSPAQASDAAVPESEPAKSAPSEQPAEPPENANEQTHYEKILSNSKYSLGLLAGYGFELFGRPDLGLVEVLPSVAFPIDSIKGKIFYRGVLEYKIEPVLGLFSEYNDHGEVGIFPLGLRYNFTALDGRLMPYIEGQLGAVYLDVPKKIQGTRFNFMESAGAGVRYFLSDKLAVNIQARYKHMSNAGIRKPNGGISSAFLLLGLDYY